jgi:hypothetical protein
MATRGYDVASGDSWAINEVPSTIRSSQETRDHLRAAVRGLFEGPAGAANVQGAVFVEGMGSTLQYFAEYKPAARDLLSDSALWQQMIDHVAWWAQEVYVDPSNVCVSGASLAATDEHIDAYTMHIPRLASAGPASANTAQWFLDRHYVPMLNASFHSQAYGTAAIGLWEMERFVSTQIHATRAWAPQHSYPGHRVGLAWSYDSSAVTPAQEQTLAARVAASLHGSYNGASGDADGACAAPGGDTWCRCSVPGASFNEGWESFASW